MEYRRFGQSIVVRMDKGEEILDQLKKVCGKEKVKLAKVQALGAISECSVGLFNTAEKKYYSNEFREPMEIVSLTGTITTMDGDYYAHIHMSAATADGKVYGGHLNRAVISATCEMVIDVIDGTVDRAFSPEVGLNLYKFV